MSKCRSNDGGAEDAKENTMSELWKKFMYLFENDIDDVKVFSIDYIIYTLLKIVSAVIIIPLWIIIGAVTFEPFRSKCFNYFRYWNYSYCS